MNLYIKQKVFSWADKFDIWRDDPEGPAFSAKGEMFSWGKKLHVYDDQGAEVAFINQKVWSFLPRYFVQIDGEQVATIVKEFEFFRPKFRIEGPDWRVEGNVWDHEYELMDKNGNAIMHMHKHWFSWGDSYELSIARDEDALLCLCTALAIDATLASEQH